VWQLPVWASGFVFTTDKASCRRFWSFEPAPPQKVCYALLSLIFPRRPAGATSASSSIMAVRCKDQGRSRKSTAKNENKNKAKKRGWGGGK